jgi:c-di-GMP-binding flagellar brake protein YcgR
MRECRRSSRFPLQTDVELLLGDGRSVRGRSYNLSFEGLSVRTSEPPPAGTRVRVRAALPVGSGNRTFAAHCRVVHVNHIDARRGFRVGLEFLALRKRDAEALEAFFGARR